MTSTIAIAPANAPLDATVVVPGSRSVSNRALMCAALAEGSSRLRGLLRADDTAAMIDCLAALGVAVSGDGTEVEVDGTGGRLRSGPVDLFARLSGTTSRFVMALLALGHGAYRLDGEEPLRRRPMADGIGALRALGVEVEAGDPGHLPIVVHASGELAREVSLPGGVSSQFLSGLLLMAPASPAGLGVGIVDSLKSRPYVDMTIAVMDAFGATVGRDGDRFDVAPSGYRPSDYRIEPDASTACYFWAAAAIRGGRVRVEGLHDDALQGDVGFVDVLEQMGCTVERGADHIEVRRGGPLRGIDVDLSDISDQTPTLAVVAAVAESPSTVTGVGFIRAKESDRVGGTVAELRRLGVDAVELDDGFEVRPSRLHGGTVRTYDDHRMAMSFALAGLVVEGVEIEDPSCVDKTFPGYWKALASMRTRSLPGPSPRRGGA
ncbi:MAG TPA: 3-phosphoshikimate 1-carboxyvinyltransferase [Microthrixaceae bacterium]|nr:3-phosphoshikimate 1-carboxyvinyltransferase [Microthrixaceae bacterium]